MGDGLINKRDAHRKERSADSISASSTEYCSSFSVSGSHANVAHVKCKSLSIPSLAPSGIQFRSVVFQSAGWASETQPPSSWRIRHQLAHSNVCGMPENPVFCPISCELYTVCGKCTVDVTGPPCAHAPTPLWARPPAPSL
jgi:hypothetical protein